MFDMGVICLQLIPQLPQWFKTKVSALGAQYWETLRLQAGVWYAVVQSKCVSVG